MNYPLVLVCGQSGTGKSYSLRNLDKKRTCILNIERKVLPFKEALKFENNIEIEKVGGLTVSDSFESQLDKALASPNYDIVVIESFTKYVEMLLSHSKKIMKGYEIYNYYNDCITATLDRIKKNLNKFVIVLAIDERVESISNSGAITTSRRCKVAGKQWEGTIEKEFAIVLFTDVKQEKGKQSEYRLLVNNDGTCSAKSPPKMFERELNGYIDNDLNSVVEDMKKYYEIVPTENKPAGLPALPPMQTYATAK